ncbi:MAG: hypothetical protein ABIE68_03795 [bacterium]
MSKNDLMKAGGRLVMISIILGVFCFFFFKLNFSFWNSILAEVALLGALYIFIKFDGFRNGVVDFFSTLGESLGEDGDKAASTGSIGGSFAGFLNRFFSSLWLKILSILTMIAVAIAAFYLWSGFRNWLLSKAGMALIAWLIVLAVLLLIMKANRKAMIAWLMILAITFPTIWLVRYGWEKATDAYTVEVIVDGAKVSTKPFDLPSLHSGDRVEYRVKGKSQLTNNPNSLNVGPDGDVTDVCGNRPRGEFQIFLEKINVGSGSAGEFTAFKFGKPNFVVNNPNAGKGHFTVTLTVNGDSKWAPALVSEVTPTAKKVITEKKRIFGLSFFVLVILLIATIGIRKVPWKAARIFLWIFTFVILIGSVVLSDVMEETRNDFRNTYNLSNAGEVDLEKLMFWKGAEIVPVPIDMVPAVDETEIDTYEVRIPADFSDWVEVPGLSELPNNHYLVATVVNDFQYKMDPEKEEWITADGLPGQIVRYANLTGGSKLKALFPCQDALPGALIVSIDDKSYLAGSAFAAKVIRGGKIKGFALNQVSSAAVDNVSRNDQLLILKVEVFSIP